MRFTQEAWQQLRPLFSDRASVEFDYHGQHRVGQIDTVGEGPQGAFLTIRHRDGVFKSYSLAKVKDLRFGSRDADGFAGSSMQTRGEIASV
jgi:hypothetical protein